MSGASHVDSVKRVDVDAPTLVLVGRPVGPLDDHGMTVLHHA